MHINLTKASEMLIGGKGDIDMIELSNSSECQTINPRYLPQSVECGQDNFFCWAESHKKVVMTGITKIDGNKVLVYYIILI